MAWRNFPLPKGWGELRQAVLARDGYRCTWYPGGTVAGYDYTACYGHPYRCSNKATDVDHIQDSNNHNVNNLRSLCNAHHSSKTSSFAHKERKQRNERKMKRNAGKDKRHPGLLLCPICGGRSPYGWVWLWRRARSGTENVRVINLMRHARYHA